MDTCSTGYVKGLTRGKKCIHRERSDQKDFTLKMSFKGPSISPNLGMKLDGKVVQATIIQKSGSTQIDA